MKPIIIDRRARKELEKAIGYYEKKRAGLGIEFLREIEKAVAKIEENPQLGMPYKATAYRFWRVRRFPYVIFFLDLDESIWIAAYAHGRRRPDYWRRRRVRS